MVAKNIQTGTLPNAFFGHNAAVLSPTVHGATVAQLTTYLQTGTGLVSSKFIRGITRDAAATNGDVSYTNFGFKPTALIIRALVNGTQNASWGNSDSAKNQGCLYNYLGTSWSNDASYIIILYTSAGNVAVALLKSYDSDGFTLTWTKLAGVPTGTITFEVLALK